MDESEIEIIRKQEEELLNPAYRKRLDLLKALLAEELIEIASDGRLYKYDEIIAALLDEEIDIKRRLIGFQARVLTPVIVQTIYIAEKTEKSGNVKQSLRSSIWKKYPEGWKMIFHQGSVRVKN